MKSFFSAATQITMVLTLSLLVGMQVFGKEYNLKDYIPTNYVGTDQTVNVQRLFDDAITGGGGSIRLSLPGIDNTPLKICGSLLLWTPTEPHGPVGIVIEGENTIIVTCENQDQTLFNTGNLTHLTIKNLQVVSSRAYSQVPDTKTVLRTGYVARLTLDNVTIAGITVPAKMIEIYYSDVVNITNSDFSGNASGFTGIFITGTRVVSLSHSKFHDYLELKVKGNNWNFYSDTSWNYGYWIYASDVHILKTDNIHIDEGARVQIRVDNSLFANFNFTSFDVAGVDGGSGVFLNNVKQSIFDQCSTGLTYSPVDMAVFRNGSKGRVNYGFLRKGWNAALTNAKYISADSTSSVSLFESLQMESRPLNVNHNAWYYFTDPNSQPIAGESVTPKMSRNTLKTGNNYASEIETGYMLELEKYKNTKVAQREIETRKRRIEEKANRNY